MNGKTMLILVGGRSAVPTICGVLQFIEEIGRIKFLVCEGKEYEKLQHIITDFIQSRNQSIVFDIEKDAEVVNPNDFTKVSKALSNLIRETNEIVFASLASAPQTMSISTYSFLEKNFPDTTIFTVSTDQAKIIVLKNDIAAISIDKKLNVKDYVVACGQEIYQIKSEINVNFKNRDQLKDVITYITENIETTDPVLSEIRRQSGGGDNINSIKKVSLSDKFAVQNNIAKSSLIDFVEKLEDSRLIRDLDFSEEIYFRVEPKSFSFLKGDWLELFAYLKALECEFDSIESGVETTYFNGEVDLFCLHNSNALICECKTGKVEKNEILKLRNLAEKLGGAYCTKILVVSSLEVPEKIQQEAENSKVVLFTGKDFSNLSELLKQEMYEPRYGRR